MNALTEHEQRILSELEESGEADVVGILNSAIGTTGNPSEITALKQAVTGLITSKMIELSLQTFQPRTLEILNSDSALELISEFVSLLRHGEHGPYWHYATIDIRKDRYPTLVITGKGLDDARKILAHRGYQWWAPKKVQRR